MLMHLLWLLRSLLAAESAEHGSSLSHCCHRWIYVVGRPWPPLFRRHLAIDAPLLLSLPLPAWPYCALHILRPDVELTHTRVGTVSDLTSCQVDEAVMRAASRGMRKQLKRDIEPAPGREH